MIRVNGTEYLDYDPDRKLSAWLREDLDLTGTKIGCNEAECGSCSILVNGTPVDSCIYPALRAQGAEVLTIEGLAGSWQDQCRHAGRARGRMPVPAPCFGGVLVTACSCRFCACFCGINPHVCSVLCLRTGI